MEPLRFTWHAPKAAANRRKHGVTFEEAQTVFSDDAALLLDDPEHATDEERFLLLGLSATPRLLVVVHCYRADDGVIHLISARKATRSERAQYDARSSR
jgi:uncharacterized DUF497 family protein